MSPSANFLSTPNYTTAICPLVGWFCHIHHHFFTFFQLGARHLQINQTMGPSHLPALREPDSLTHDFVNRFPFDLRHAITPQAPVHTQVRSDLVLNPAFTALSHLIPHQPIHLPKTRSSPASRTSYKQAETTEAEYIKYTTPYTVIAPHTATTLHTATAPYIIPDLFPSMSSSSSNSTNSSDLFVNPHNRLFTISNDIPPRIAEVRMYIAFMRVRFGCCITDNLIKRLINPELLAKPLLSFDDSQLETYKRHVRSWTALTTGTTIFKRLRVALEPGTYFNNERYTVPYFWFVLLVRELLIDNSYAVGSGALTRLGARCMDPCNRSFLFFSLEAAIRQLLKEIDSKSHFNSRDPTSQRKIVGKCHGDHLHIATSSMCFISGLFWRSSWSNE